MDKKLAQALTDANKKLKEKNIFENYQLQIDGDFTTEFNEVRLSSNKSSTHFPIANAETEGEAITIIKAYIIGLRHGEEKSYPKFCDKNY